MSRYFKPLLVLAGVGAIGVVFLLVWRGNGRDWDLSRGYYEIGMQLEKSGRQEEAIGIYKRAVNLFPENADPLYRLGVCYLALKDADSARRVLIRANELSPGRYDICFQLGVLYYYHYRDRAKSIQWLERSIELNPDYAAARKLLRDVREGPR